jgi:putative methyltransferase
MIVYLADPIHTYIGTRDSRFIPLSALNVAAYVQKIFGDQVQLKVFKFPERLMDAIESQPPDIIGVSNYIWNYRVSKAALDFAKRCNPKVVTVMGGPNATLTEPKMTALLADGVIDYYVPDSVTGGEKPFAGLVGALLAGANPVHEHSGVHGIWLKDKNTQRARLVLPHPSESNMEWLPSPFQTGLADEFFDDGLAAMIETNRGCPFHCSFCVWGNGSKVTQFGVDRVRADLDYCSERAKQKLLMINDANFGLFKKRDLEIAQHIRKLNREVAWPDNIVVNWGQVRSESSIAVANELKGITILRQSSQTMNEDVLKSIKRNNIPDFQWKYVAEECRRDGIESFAELIIMLPGETLESYLAGLRYFFKLGINCVNTNQCQLLEGAEMNTEEHRTRYGVKTAWRLLEDAYGKYKDYTCIEAEEVVTETNTLSFEENMMARLLNWLIQMSWTIRRHDVILKVMLNLGHSPVDFLMRVIRNADRAPEGFRKLMKDFDRDARAELFPSYQALREHYSKQEELEKLRNGGFSKLNTLYSGRALAVNSEIIKFYCDIATEFMIEQGEDTETFLEMLDECAKFAAERSLSVSELDNLEIGSGMEKTRKFAFDIASWDRDPENRPLTSHRVSNGVSYRFHTSAEQGRAVKEYMEGLSHKGKEFQLKRLCEPFYGIKKEYLNFYVSAT